MKKSAKVTISLPTSLLSALERQQVEQGCSRSELIAGLLTEAILHENERRDVERYIVGYRAQPETAAEMAVTDQLTAEAALSDPWP